MSIIYVSLYGSTPLSLAGESLCGNSRTDFLLSPCQGTDTPFASPLLSHRSEDLCDSIIYENAIGKAT